MKTSKKILATIVAIMLVVTSMSLPTFAAFTDLETGAASYTAATVLNNLGVINGYPDGSFGPDKNVTRAEFTAMLLRTRGMGSIGSTSLENPPFPDVTTSDVSWAIANIRTAYEMGIINGYDDGTFKPNNDVLYEEAVKMIVCALGYGDMGVDSSVWYAKYITTATSLGFTSGAGGAIGTPATRAVIANMLYNCLEVNLAENNTITNKTVLENDLNLTKNVGYISANSEISLTQADPNLRADEVEITIEDAYGALTTATYKVDDTSKYEDMLGAQITFYYTTDRNSGYKYLTLATVKNTETIEIPATDIYGSTGSSIEYLKNSDDSKTTIVSVNPNAVVVYNGKLYSTTDKYTDFESDKEMPTIGSVKLLDRDGDNKYDVVFVEDYEAWVVSSVTSSDKTISDNILRSNGKLVLDSEKVSGTVKIVDKNGAETTFSSISKGSVVSVKTDSYGNITAVVTNDSVSGKITATDSKKGVTINSKTYKFSNQAPWKNGGSLAEPVYGDSGKFYLDIDGNIVAYDKTEAVVTQYYGYMTGSGYDTSSFNNLLQVAIATKNDPEAEKVYNITTKTKIIEGGTATQVSDLSVAYTTIQAKAENKGVKFTLSGSDIDELVISEASASGSTVEANRLYEYKGDGISTATDWEYNSSTRVLKSGTKTIRLEGADTILNDKDDSKMTASNFINGAKYDIEAYDVSNTGAAKLIIVFDWKEDEDYKNYVKAASPIVYVESANPETMADGEIRTILKGYQGNTEKNYTLSTKNTLEVKEGDVVRISEKNGEYTVSDVIFRVGERSTATGNKDVDDDKAVELLNAGGSVAYIALWGSAYKLDDETDGGFIMSTNVVGTIADSGTDDEDGNDIPLAPTINKEYTFDKAWFKNAKFIVYDASATDKFTDITADGYENILVNSKLTCVDGAKIGETPSQLFVYMNGASSVATVIIIK